MLDKKFFEETESKITEVMDSFASGPMSDDDWSNFETLKTINADLARKMSSEDHDQGEVSEFLSNFVEELDNTYADGLPEAIIVALKSGKRIGLTKDWWSRKNV